jgi:Recombination endonuclease VII
MPRNRNKTYEEQRGTRIRSYGITVEEYDDMLESQGGGCYICGIGPVGRALDIDHDHRTGKVRGLLCSNHNRALGLLGDDPDLLLAAHTYLVQQYV